MHYLGSRRNAEVFSFVVILFSICSMSNSNSTEEDICTVLQQPIARVINHFARRLTDSIGGNGNIFFSPLSLSTALGMLYLGARGETAEEMRNELGYNLLESNGTSEDVHLNFRSLIIALIQFNDEYKLLVANSIYSQINYEVRQEYIEDLAYYYDAKEQSLDFLRDGLHAIEVINDWVSNKTDGKITNFFKQPLDPDTIMVLLNAVYFKGNWKIPFDERMTIEDDFYGLSGVETVPFMQLRKQMNLFYDSDTNHDFLELDYIGDHVSMIFALPRTENNDTSLELNTRMLCKIRSGFRKRLTHICIPKIKLSYERELSQDFKNLGMSDMFDENTANFTGIRDVGRISVSMIMHKAVIDVNEQGSEAAAASGIIMNARSGLQMYETFIANHPFIFIILDKRSGSILFMGRINDATPP